MEPKQCRYYANTTFQQCRRPHSTNSNFCAQHKNKIQVFKNGRIQWNRNLFLLTLKTTMPSKKLQTILPNLVDLKTTKLEIFIPFNLETMEKLLVLSFCDENLFEKAIHLLDDTIRDNYYFECRSYRSGDISLI